MRLMHHRTGKKTGRLPTGPSPLPQKQVGPYLIEEQLGSGGMGEVYRAYDQRLDRHVAVKRIRPDQAADPRAREGFLREARLAASFHHPALVRVHDILEIEGDLWIVMEWVEGRSLAALLKKGPLPLDAALAVSLDLVSGLAAIHRAGILHRDLKSENVLVAPSTSFDPARSGRARILDFGLATVADDAVGSGTGSLRGTPKAMAPEQLEGQDPSHRSDLFALGTLFYEMFAGRSPFLGDDPVETLSNVRRCRPDPLTTHAPNLPEGLVRLVHSLLSKHPADRPGSADEVAAALDRIACRSSTPCRRSPGSNGIAPWPWGESKPRGFRRKGERRRLTVVCCELVSRRSGTLDPEILYEGIPRFQQLARELAERFEGCVDTSQGHRSSIYFGHPESREDSALRAVSLALEIVDRVKQGPNGPAGSSGLAARAGVHTGPVLVLMPPSEKPRLVLGETLDLALQIQNRAAPDTVLISSSTACSAPETFLLDESGSLPRAPLDRPLNLYRIASSDQIRGRAVKGGGPLPWVARDGELDFIAGRMRAAGEGNSQVVLLSGVPGIGKTRLLETLRERSKGKHRHWLTARGRPCPRQTPFLPVLSLVRRALDLDLRDDLPELSELLVHADRLETEASGESPQAALRRELADLLPEVLLALAQQEGQALPLEPSRPTVLVFEDLQWLDRATLEVVGRLIEWGSGVPLLLLLTCRPDFHFPWGTFDHLSRLHLSPLSRSRSKALVRKLAGDQELAAALEEKIVERSGGLPLYIEELTRQALRSVEPETSAGCGVPATLLDGLNAQIDRSSGEVDLLLSAAALGEDLRRAELSALWGGETASFDRRLEQLLLSRLLERGEGDRLRFGDALLRDVAWARLLDDDREELQKRARAHRLPPPADLLTDAPPVGLSTRGEPRVETSSF